MSVSVVEQANEARRQAVAEVQRLLTSADDLKRLGALRQDVLTKQQANKAQLSAAVASQVEATKAGLDSLARSHQALLALRTHFADISRLCAECQSLIDCHDKIAVLSEVHRNLGKTLQDVENIAALPVEAAEAEAMLRDNANLLQVYEMLACLEGTSLKAQAALESGANLDLRMEAGSNLGSYFQKVRATMGKFEERLWSIVRNFLRVAKEDPELLVTALQVVELQEMVDAQLVAAGQGGSPLRKAWRRRCLAQVGNAIQEGFAPLLQQCSQLIAAGENTDKRVSEILGEADQFVDQLAPIYDHVAPCFPPSYRIFPHICAEHHRQLGSMVDFIGLCADNLANSDILKVMQWIAAYQDALGEFGVEESEVAFPAGPHAGLSLLIGKYVERIAATLSAWLINIVEGDFKSEPKTDQDGRVWTPGAVDFFRILNEQVTVVADVDQGVMLLRVGQSAVQTMLDFHAAQRAHLAGGMLPLEQLCAVVNNNVRCYDESLEFAEGLEDALGDAYKGSLDVEDACRGFLDLAKEGAAGCVATVFSDPAFADLFSRVACSEEWKRGELTGSVLATLEDFLQDFERMVQPAFYRRLAEALLEETVAHYVAGVLCFLRGVSEEDLAALQRDDARIRAFFTKYTKMDKVVRECQPLAELREFLGGDSVEAFVLSYTALLTSAPGISPTLLANLIGARAATDRHMTKADAREILEHCREVYADRQARAGGEEAGGGAAQAAAAAQTAAQVKGGKAPTAREVAFRAAVNAARRRGGGALSSPSKPGLTPG
ncbi:exocyst complex component Sec6 [Micractinium conductrix]|uniref:Exocyst complex component Sec6 n=1 Tax=Micractinium conductrix TaxID=554055 RepID=A0A2P6V5G0_9CHLO|nr:exocyst complex component Sec6 [Micractinium conductrix]|eukprot:PSC69331.1 exocyst complex component Sec6 [Micractinium conductrix]